MSDSLDSGDVPDAPNSHDFLMVITTVETQEQALRLGNLLVESALAACVQVLPPMVSIYRWQGAIEQANEVLLLIKTTRSAFPRLETAVKKNHPYQTPELIAAPIVAGSKDYLSWMLNSVDSRP
jgi:periplasmic divalent cation tolerance protein